MFNKLKMSNYIGDMPSPFSIAGTMYIGADEVMYISDGKQWKRMSDGAVVSDARYIIMYVDHKGNDQIAGMYAVREEAFTAAHILAEQDMEVKSILTVKITEETPYAPTPQFKCISDPNVQNGEWVIKNIADIHRWPLIPECTCQTLLNGHHDGCPTKKV